MATKTPAPVDTGQSAPAPIGPLDRGPAPVQQGTAQPASAAYAVTNAGGGGFNQLRMFSRSAGSEVQSGNIGFVKVYNGVLDLATIQSQYNTYKARFGY
jgi:hypothetical protein